MAESNILITLRNKRDEIERLIASYEKAIEEARSQLAHVTATLHLFEGGTFNSVSYGLGLSRLFKRGEMFSLCKQALEASPDGLDTRELARHIIKARGLDETDKVLHKKIAYHVIHIMKMRAARGSVVPLAKRKGVRVWKSPG